MTSSAVFIQAGEPIVFKASGGDVAFTPKNVANGAGRISARADLGDFPRPGLWRWHAETQAQATPTVGNWLEIRMAWWNDDATPGESDGAVGDSDAGFSTESKLRNLKRVGEVICDSAAADTVFRASGTIWIPVRYVSIVWWNRLGADLTNDDAEHVFTLTPIFDNIQAAA